MIADFLIRNARVWSEGALLPGQDAVAIRAGEIIAVGRGEELEMRALHVLDAGGATVTPGLCDAHIHLVAWALAGEEVRLEGIRSRQDVLRAVATFIERRPERDPVIGRGWDATHWESAPDLGSLDAVGGGRAVLLHSKDFHALWVNSVALGRARVDQATPDPPDGCFERAADGGHTGIVREHAVRAFEDLLRPHDAPSIRGRVRAAAAALLREGVTAIHDFEADEEAERLRELVRGAGPRVRVLMHVARAGFPAALEEGRRSGQGDDWFRWGALKLFADGTLGSRTAAVLEPYDDTGETGMDLLPPAELRELVGRAFGGGLSVAVHAIGDRAVRHVLDAFEATRGPALPLPPRIEHAQLVHERDVPRFAALDVAASMQPTHCTSDIPLVERAWGARASRSYPWRRLLESGARIAFGSDAPVEEPSIARGLHAAITRERDGRSEPFEPGQCLTLDQALSAYTEMPARLGGVWPRSGRIAIGALADIVVWNTDLHRTPSREIANARPRWTLLDGQRVFDAEADDSRPADLPVREGIA